MSTGTPPGPVTTRPRWFATAAALVVALLLAAVMPAAASAHPSLVQSAPLGGLSADQPPTAVRLAFTEGVIARGSSIEVRGPRGERVATGPLRVSDGSLLVAPLRGSLRPAVYDVRWVALGSDGHTTSGSFRFGVSGPKGSPPPGAERLGGGASTGIGSRGGEDVSGEGWFELAVRWLGLLGAATLLGGVLLRWRVPRAQRGPGAERRWQRLATLALALSLFGAAEAVAVLATAGVGDPSLALLTGNGNGRIALLRLLLAAALGGAGLWLRRRNDPRSDGLLAASGVVALIAYGTDGHVQGLGDGTLVAALLGALHGVAAGVWAGGLVALAVLGGGRRALRALAPFAIAAIVVLSVTGLVAALREVDGWYYLRWTGYGRVLAVKVLLVALAVGAGAVATRRLRHSGGAGAGGSRLLRGEAVLAVTVLVLAAVLAGLVPGRGRPVAAQQGNVLGGPALATTAIGGQLLRLTVAPATPGRNVVVADPTTLAEGTPGRAPARIDVRLRCACSTGEVRAQLRRGPGDAWSAAVELPAAGTWFAYPAVDGRRESAPAAFPIGDLAEGGPAPRHLIQTADLSGRQARTCRAHAQGASLAVGRLNAKGGVDGGRKLVLRTVDDGGDPARAAAAVRAAGDAVALLAPCGDGAEAAVRAAGDRVTVVGEPSVPLVRGRRVFRTGGDPRAEGVAIGRFVAEQGLSSRPSAVPRITVLRSGRSVASDARIAGLREAVAGTPLRVVVEPPSAIADPRRFARAIDAAHQLVTVVDGDRRRLAAALRRLGRDQPRFPYDAIVATSPLFDERFEVDSGALARAGAIISASELQLGSQDAEAYANVIPLLFPGERPSIAGLRGYVAGLALDEGLRDGTDAGDVERRLRRPRRFTDALVAPWRADRRWAGGPLFQVVNLSFLPENLIPEQAGGSKVSGRFFADGAWAPLQGRIYGPTIRGLNVGPPAPAPPITGSPEAP
ncbi:ABC transporter substrate-binding protein [Patulibacter defluvii]|uniref:ABC transporter substrate-binding protein n=1 Tax=Patulibacter defluvii TaxID=3095358 RepID=UPI002A764DA5|nr:ABC transporter substrate-binding protein [Patulibacter sp. DM4]